MNNVDLPKIKNKLAKDATLREHFAGLAMQGLMSNSNARVTCLQCAEISVSHADALLDELDKVKS
jgi:hypothetical protein